MVERKLNFREDFIPIYNRTDNVSGNYFPMTSLAYIENDSFNLIKYLFKGKE